MAILLIYSLLFIALVTFTVGVYILVGIGATLIAFSVCLVMIAGFLTRGLTNGEQTS